MRSRNLPVVLALAAVTLVGVGVFALWPEQNRITLENFDRIRKGMSMADVEGILGPPGDYSNGPVNYDGSAMVYFVPAEGTSVVHWTGDAGFGRVYFDSSGKVDDQVFEPGRREKQSPIDNLLWRAKRQWRRWFSR
jgi:hypothetical protein